MFFEGSEKKLEVSVSTEVKSLRERGDDFWSAVVEASQAKILSKISNDSCDAYLLSESSLFVYEHNLIMITCGQTHLIAAVLKILEEINKEDITALFYERKHEVFPRRQPSSFSDDIRKLAEIFPGQAYRFGHEAEHFVQLFHLDKTYTPEKDDYTLEVLMHGVSDKVVEVFNGKEKPFNDETCKLLGVRSILPDFKVDDFFFQPSGYSLNAVRGSDYYTIHVTPQEVGSYVSFETNYNHHQEGNLSETVEKVLNIFEPKSVDIVLFEPDRQKSIQLDNYELRQEILQKIDCGYNVGFYQYDKPFAGAESAQKIEIN